MTLSGKSVLIVAPNQLTLLGLKTILLENFSPDDVDGCASIDESRTLTGKDVVFMPAETYVHCMGRIRTLKAHVIVLSEDDPAPAGAGQASGPDMLFVKASEQEIVERLETIFSSIRGRSAEAQSDTLTARETDVLRAVAQGRSNKQIADALSISMHTVISHRKNITQKLGIKTVSGLTMYALLHGLISMKNPN